MLTMLCPYHAGELHPEILAAARRTHPVVRTRGHEAVSSEFVDARRFHRSMRQSPLPLPPPGVSSHVALGRQAARQARESVDAFATAASVPHSRRAELVAAVDEVVAVATNGAAANLSLRMWTDVHGLTCDISGQWVVPSEYPAFLKTPAESEGLPGLWTAGQRCDLIAVRERGGVTTVRLRVGAEKEPPRSCADVSELLGVYALGACDVDEAAQIETHLGGCPACSIELGDLTDVVTALELAYRPLTDPLPDDGTDRDVEGS
jgi:hypothetical protein